MGQLLEEDEWVLFQIKEGPCNALCDYCYDAARVAKLLKRAQDRGEIELDQAIDLDHLTTRSAFILAQRHKKELKLEMSLDEVIHHFNLFNQVGIDRAGLIGSEPTRHPQFQEILDEAGKRNINLLVYTSGAQIEQLVHPAVSQVVLHLNFQGGLKPDNYHQDLMKGIFPPAHIVKDIEESLIRNGKKVDLRINFTEAGMYERYLTKRFYELLEPEFRKEVLLKYSFSSRVPDDPRVKFFVPDDLMCISNLIMGFVDELKEKFPEVSLYAERPLFRCAFSDKDWQEYQEKGGFTSTCRMEFTIYPESGLALCPPAWELIKGKKVETGAQLIERIGELRESLKEIYRQPSFYNCVSCKRREDLSCSGGCLGNKEIKK